MLRNVHRFNSGYETQIKAKVPLRYDNKNGLMPYLRLALKNEVSRLLARYEGFNGKSHGRGSPLLQEIHLTVDGTLSNYYTTDPTLGLKQLAALLYNSHERVDTFLTAG